MKTALWYELASALVHLRLFFYGLVASATVWSYLMATSAANRLPDQSRPIVVGFTAGGPSDIVARMSPSSSPSGWSSRSSSRTRRRDRHDRRRAGAKAPADGYALYLASQTTHAVAPYMYAKFGYDPIKDFATIVRVVHNPLLVVVNPSVPVKSIKDLIALARRVRASSTLRPAAWARRRTCRWSSSKAAELDMVPFITRATGLRSST